MSYRRDKQKKINFFYIGLFGFSFLVLIIILRFGFPYLFEDVASLIARPFIAVAEGVKNTSHSFGSYFTTKSALEKENNYLSDEVNLLNAQGADVTMLEAENTELKIELGRTVSSSNTVLSRILIKPPVSPYDTILVELDPSEKIVVGDLVFAENTIAIGQVTNVFSHSAQIQLFSAPNVTTNAELIDSHTQVALIGQGGSNFRISLPEGTVLNQGAVVVIPGLISYPVATVGRIVSDPRDPFETVLLTSPVNIQEVGWVQIQK